MSDKNNSQSPTSFSEKDVDDWFDTLRGKSTEDVKPEIKKDADLFRELLINSKEKEESHGIIGFTPYAAIASLVIVGFVLSMIMPLDFWKNDYDNHSIDSSFPPFGVVPGDTESQPDFIKALNQPVYIEHLDNFIVEMEKTLANRVQFEKEPYYDKGIVIRISIQTEPDAELTELLKTYGFKADVGQQNLYFTDEKKQD